MKQGDAFLWTGVTNDAHLWIVLSDPARNPDELVIVSVSTWEEGAPEECTFRKGEHPFFRKDLSYVAFHRALLISAREFAKQKREDMVPLPPELVKRILEGADRTEVMPRKCKRVLQDQGLFDGL